ncbi:MAG: DUF1073 domain-containing protein [Halobacteria archaeon]|nr:DUF1073 domain-containing protein [Halobacteria archaeon]
MADDDVPDDQPSTAEVTEAGDLLGQAVDGDMEAQEFVSDMVQRVAVADAMGESWGNLDERDYYDTLGYPSPSQLDIDDYWAMFKRGGIAETIVTAVSEATWNDVPDVDDHSGEDEDETTDFETDVEALFEDTGALTAIRRADTLQRIGRFGVLYVGYDDGFDEMSDPVDPTALSGDPSDDILYYQPFSEKQIEDFERETDPNDERFGKPATYDLDFGDQGLGVETVHHSRVLHIAEGALEDEVVGYSAYRPVFNHLVDLLYKVMGGSAEMYWRSADRKIVANQTEGGTMPDEDKVVKQIEELVHNLRNVAWTQNVEMESLSGETPDPTGLKDGLIELIAGNLRIPKRKLLGTERGDLASTQDEMAFVQAIEERRNHFAGPQIFRKFVGMQVEYGVVANPRNDSYDIDWPDNFELTELEEAELKQRLAKAYKDLAATDPSELATLEERREEVLGLPPKRGEAVDLPTEGDVGGDGEDDSDTDVGVDDLLDEDDPEVDDWFEETFELDLDEASDLADARTDGGS